MAIDPLLRIVFSLFVLFGCVRSDLPEVAPVSDGVAVPPPTPTASFEQSAAPSSTISPPAVVSSNPLEISFYGNGTATTLNDAVMITSVQFQGRVVGDSGPCNASPLFAPRAQGPFTDAQTSPSAPGVHPAPSTVATATPMYSAPPLEVPVSATWSDILADALLPWRWTPFQAFMVTLWFATVAIARLGLKRTIAFIVLVYACLRACPWRTCTCSCSRTPPTSATPSAPSSRAQTPAPPSPSSRSPPPLPRTGPLMTSDPPFMETQGSSHLQPRLHGLFGGSTPPVGIPPSTAALSPFARHGGSTSPVGLHPGAAAPSAFTSPLRSPIPAPFRQCSAGNMLVAALSTSQRSSPAQASGAIISITPVEPPVFPPFTHSTMMTSAFAANLRAALKAYITWKTDNSHDIRNLRYAVGLAGLRHDSLDGAAANVIKMVTGMPLTVEVLMDDLSLMTILENFSNSKLTPAAMTFALLASSFNNPMESHLNYFLDFADYVNTKIFAVYTDADLATIACVPLVIAFITNKATSTCLSTFTTQLAAGDTSWRTALGAQPLRDALTLWTHAASLRLPGVDVDMMQSVFPLKLINNKSSVAQVTAPTASNPSTPMSTSRPRGGTTPATPDAASHPDLPCVIHTNGAVAATTPSRTHLNKDCKVQQVPCPNHPGATHTLGECKKGGAAAQAMRRDSPATAATPAPGAPTAKPRGDPVLRGGDVVCYNCNDKGHIASACPKPPAAGRSKRTSLRGMIAAVTTAFTALTSPATVATAATAVAAASMPTANSASTAFSSTLPPSNFSSFMASIFAPSATTSLADIAHAPPTAQGTVLGVHTSVYLDSGAAVSCMPSSFYETLSPHLRPDIVPFPAGEGLNTAFGDSVSSTSLLGSVTLPFHVLSYISSIDDPLPWPHELNQTITFAVIKSPSYEPSSSLPIYIGGKALLDATELNYLLRHLVDKKFTVFFPKQLGPLLPSHPPYQMSSDSIPLESTVISPLPGDDEDFVPYGLSNTDDPSGLSRTYTHAECAAFRESEAPLNPALSAEKADFFFTNQSLLFGHFPSLKDYPLPLISIPHRGPRIRRGLVQRFNPRDSEAIERECEKWYVSGILEDCNVHELRNVLLLIAQPKGINPQTGERKSGVRLTLDSSPLSPYYANWSPGGHAIPRGESFYYLLRDCVIAFELDFRGFYNSTMLDLESRNLFGLKTPKGRIMRSTKPPQGFCASGSISSHLLWQHVISPLLMKWSQETIPIQIPSFPPPGALPSSSSNVSLPPTTHYVEEGPIAIYVDNVSGGIRYPAGVPHPSPGSLEYNDVATRLWRTRTRPLMMLSAQCGFRFSPNSTYTTTTTGNNLGVSFTNGSELRISDLRLQGLRDFARPAKITLTDVHSIRGLFNSFSRFCNTIEFSQLVSIFTDIITTCTTTKCPAASLWTKTHDDAFDRLKVLIMDSTVLYVPDPSLPYYVRCDASAPSDISNSGSWCGMLFQYNRTGIVCPISVVSKSFTPAQASYHTKDKELAGIVLFLRVLQKYHLPSSNLVVHTDHANIAYLNSSSDHRTRTWCAELQLRNIFFQHLPGSEMRPNDALSRLPIVPPAPAPSLDSPPPPNPSVTSTISAFFSAPPTFITTTIAASKVLIKANLTQYLPLQKLFSSDELSYMESRPESFFRATIPVVAIPGATTDGQLWLHTNAVVIPSTCSDLISQTLRDAHRLGCHPREKEMTSLLTHVWWPTKSKDITAYIASCPQCQVIDAPPRSSPHGYFNINNPSAPNHTHILDHLEMSPASADGHVAILTVTCAFTRFCHLIPVKSHSAADTLDAAMTAWHATGLPVRVQTDGSTSFTADFSNYLNMFRIDHHITDAYAPWQNGKSERQHAPITTKLRKVTLGLDQTLWHLALPLIAGVLNSTTNRATGATPYFLMYAHEKRTPAVALTDLSTSTGTIAEWHAAIKQVQDVLTFKNDITSLQQAHIRAERPDVPFTFTLHQDVLLFFPTRPEKLSSFWRPGYRVTDLLPDDDTHVIVSRVEPDGLLYDPQRVPVARLRPFDSSRAPHSGALMRITDGSLAVDAIVSHTRVHEPPTPPMYTFTVSWKDPSVPHATARLQDLMLNCDPILRQYCALHKIPYSHLAAQRAHLNKQAKALAVQPLPAARATLAAIFGPFPVHPSEPTYRWL